MAEKKFISLDESAEITAGSTSDSPSGDEKNQGGPGTKSAEIPPEKKDEGEPPKTEGVSPESKKSDTGGLPKDKEENKIPQSRLDEVVHERNELRKKVEDLSKQIGEKPKGELPIDTTLKDTFGKGGEIPPKEDKDFWDRFMADPEKVLAEEINKRAGTQNKTTLELIMTQTKLEKSFKEDKNLQKLWDNYDEMEEDIVKIITREGLNISYGPAKASKIALALAKEEKGDLILSKTREEAFKEAELNKKIVDGQVSVESRGGSPPSVASLTDDEKRVARGLGISEEDYAKEKAQIGGV